MKRKICVLTLCALLFALCFSAEAQQPKKVARIGFLGNVAAYRIDAFKQGLDVSRTSFAKAQSLLKPYPEEMMDAHDVSPIINSAKYDGPDCIQPVSDNDMPRTGQLSLL